MTMPVRTADSGLDAIGHSILVHRECLSGRNYELAYFYVRLCAQGSSSTSISLPLISRSARASGLLIPSPATMKHGAHLVGFVSALAGALMHLRLVDCHCDICLSFFSNFPHQHADSILAAERHIYVFFDSDGRTGEKCILGKHITYTRRKQTSECFNGRDFERPRSVQVSPRLLYDTAIALLTLTLVSCQCCGTFDVLTINYALWTRL